MFSLFFWPALLHYCIAFNIDTNLPLVRQGDQSGSYFGFSVAQHQAKNRRTNKIDSWLLVGAPKANVSELLRQNIVNPGAIYKCDLTQSDCEQILLDDRANLKDSLSRTIEEKSNQWFGVSLHSSGLDGTVVSCAHRYLYYGPNVNYHMYPGRCMSILPSLNPRSKIFHKQCQVINDAEAKGDVEGVELASYDSQLYCQMGVSTTFINDRDAAVFGAVGSLNYQGVLFYEQMANPAYKTMVQSEKDPLGYQGYSTSIGTFFKKGQTDVVTGAPRFNHLGMVVVFESSGAKLSPTFKQKVVINPTESKGKPQPGSGFGFSVAGVDVNADGWTDVIIGAPFYSTKNSPNEGRVYVYINNGDGTFTKKSELMPTVSRKGARFGHAVANAGDLDQDGYEDFVVGAPYEDGNGVIYIFNGSATGINKKPAQIIKPSDINQNVKTFGYSISGKLDMDLNGYPDLLIGAYQSNSVVLLRSRPIIDIIANITITPNPFNIHNKTCPVTYNGKNFTTVCVDIAICLSYTERKNRTHELLRVDLDIEADVEYTKNSRTPRKSRVLFSNTNQPAMNKTISKLPHSSKKDICFSEEVFLREDVKDVYPDITFKINYKMHEPSTPPTAAPGSLPSLKDYAMLEKRKDLFATALLKFKRDCVKCEPDLRLSHKSAKTLAVGEDYVVDATISNTGESAYNAEFLVVVPEGVTHHKVMDASDAVKEAFSIGHDVSTEIRPSDNSTIIRIPIGNPMKTSTSKRIKVYLETAAFSNAQDFLPIDLEVTSSNKEQPEFRKNNYVHLNVTIVSQADLELLGSTSDEQVYYGGEIRGESAMRTEEDIGNEVRHTYIATNKGPDFVPKAVVIIDWPFEATSGKHLLYLMAVEVGGQAKCDFKPGQINLLGLQVKPKTGPSRNITSRSSSRRTRRDAQPEPNSAASSKKKRETKKLGQALEILDCKIGTAKCTQIKCIIERFKKGDEVSFVVRSRIWNATLKEDYYFPADKSDQVEVVSRATLRTGVSFVQEVNTKNNEAKVYSQFIASEPPQASKKIADWVIPVAVVGAILVLALVVLLLWKLGFFKRKKFDGNITEAEMEAILAAEKKEKNANAET